MKELFTIIKTEKGYNLTLPSSEWENGQAVKFFPEDIPTQKELFKKLTKITNC